MMRITSVAIFLCINQNVYNPPVFLPPTTTVLISQTYGLPKADHQLDLTVSCAMSLAGKCVLATFMSIPPILYTYYSGDGTMRKNDRIWAEWGQGAALALHK